MKSQFNLDLHQLRPAREFARLVYLMFFILIAYFAIDQFTAGNLRILEIYYYIVSLASFLILFSNKTEMRPSEASSTEAFCKNKLYLLWGLIFFISLAIKLYFNDRVPYWGDEIGQQYRSLAEPIILGPARDQQPPLSYFFSGWTSRLYDNNLLVIRVPVIVLSGFLLMLYFSILKIFRINTLLALFSTTFLFSTPLIFQFSIEARPQYIALLTEILLFIEIISTHFRKTTFRFLDVKLTASFFIFLTSIGMQPPIFIFAVIIIAFFHKIFSEGSKTLPIMGSAMGAILLFLPVQIYIFNQSLKYINEPSNIPKNFLDKLTHFLSNILVYDLTFFQIVAIFIFILCFLFFGNHLRKKYFLFEKLNTRFLKGAAYLTATYLLFFLFTVMAFSLFIKWELNDRYLITGTLLLAMSLVFILQFIFNFFKNYPYKKLSTSFFIAVVFTFFGYMFHQTKYEFGKSNVKQSFAVFQKILKTFHPDDLVILMCSTPNYCWDYPKSVYFMSRMDKNGQIEPLANPIYYSLWKAFQQDSFKGIHLYVNHDLPLSQLDYFQDFNLISAKPRIMLFYLTGDQKWTQFKLIMKRLKELNSDKDQFKKMFLLNDLYSALIDKQNYRGPLPLITTWSWEDPQVERFINEYKNIKGKSK